MRLPHLAVSPEHALLRWVEGDESWLVKDLGSRHGTRCNGEALESQHWRLLVDGDVLAIGPFSVGIRMLSQRQCRGTYTLPGAATPLEGLTRALRGPEAERQGGAVVLRVTKGVRRGLRIPSPAVGGRLTIGRSRRCDVVLEDLRLSRRHAALEADDGGVSLIDLGSQNGILVDGRQVTGRQPLSPGMEIRLGSSTLRVCDGLQDYLVRTGTEPELASEDESIRVDWPGALVGLSGMLASGLVLLWLLQA